MELKERLMKISEGYRTLGPIKAYPRVKWDRFVDEVALSFGNRDLVICDAWGRGDVYSPSVVLVGYTDKNLEQISYALDELYTYLERRTNEILTVLVANKKAFDYLRRVLATVEYNSDPRLDETIEIAKRSVDMRKLFRMLRAEAEMGMEDPESGKFIATSNDALQAWLGAMDEKTGKMVAGVEKAAKKGHVVQVLHNDELFGTDIAERLKQKQLSYLAAATRAG